MFKFTRHLCMIATVFALIATIMAGNALAGEETDGFRRSTASGQYVDASSFFRMHGYITLSNAELGSGFGSELEATPQILVSGLSPRTSKNESGFKNDAALFIGGEPFGGVGTVIEIHFVGDAADPVITEAKLSWNVVGSDEGTFALRAVGGRFWWPFGIHNQEWFSALNRFGVISPAAAEVVPAHFNEVGIMLEGEAKFDEDWGINFVSAIGNGVPGFSLMQNIRATQFDENDNRTLTGRAALVHLGGTKAEFGFSAAGGTLRADPTTPVALSLALDDPLRYEASFLAFGPDFTFSSGRFNMRSYYYVSSEDFTNAPIDKFDRSGFTIEPAYEIPLKSEVLKSVSFIGRYSNAKEERMNSSMLIEELQRTQFGFAVNLKFQSKLTLKASWVGQDEDKDLPYVSNNAFTLGFTGEF